MRSYRLLAAALTFACATSAATARAQAEGAVDLGLYGRVTFPDDGLTDKMPLGGGGRLGIFLKRNLALEFEASRNETEKANYLMMLPVSARLAYHHHFTEKWTGIIGAGWVRDYIDPPGVGERWPDDGITALLGVQRQLRGRMALRIDAVGEQHFSPIFQTLGNDIEHTHFAVQFGLTWRFNDDELQPAPPPMVAPVIPAPAPPADSDRDGVLDPNDACANTPAGTRVDASGCPVPVDTDGDGVLDNADRCSGTPAGSRVDANGCPIPVDSDRDGVMDNADRCANTPAGTRVDANGCAVPVDSDGDGVMDGVDACANTARGTPVDARGCARIFEEGQRNIVLEGVTFNTGSAILTDGAKVQLDRMAALLAGAPDVNVEVQGHTDNTGVAATNTRLSGLRAEAVRAYLVSKGVAATRLTAKGYGSSMPVADNATPAGRAQNRRVELKRTN